MMVFPVPGTLAVDHSEASGCVSNVQVPVPSKPVEMAATALFVARPTATARDTRHLFITRLYGINFLASVAVKHPKVNSSDRSDVTLITEGEGQLSCGWLCVIVRGGL